MHEEDRADGDRADGRKGGQRAKKEGKCGKDGEVFCLAQPFLIMVSRMWG